MPPIHRRHDLLVLGSVGSSSTEAVLLAGLRVQDDEYVDELLEEGVFIDVVGGEWHHRRRVLGEVDAVKEGLADQLQPLDGVRQRISLHVSFLSLTLHGEKGLADGDQLLHATTDYQFITSLHPR